MLYASCYAACLHQHVHVLLQLSLHCNVQSCTLYCILCTVFCNGMYMYMYHHCVNSFYFYIYLKLSLWLRDMTDDLCQRKIRDAMDFEWIRFPRLLIHMSSMYNLYMYTYNVRVHVLFVHVYRAEWY